jgi:hypothetical protein
MRRPRPRRWRCSKTPEAKALGGQRSSRVDAVTVDGRCLVTTGPKDCRRCRRRAFRPVPPEADAGRFCGKCPCSSYPPGDVDGGSIASGEVEHAVRVGDFDVVKGGRNRLASAGPLEQRAPGGTGACDGVVGGLAGGCGQDGRCLASAGLSLSGTAFAFPRQGVLEAPSPGGLKATAPKVPLFFLSTSSMTLATRAPATRGPPRRPKRRQRRRPGG